MEDNTLPQNERYDESNGAYLEKGTDGNDLQSSTMTSSYLSSWHLASVIISLLFGTFLVALDTNIIGVALPEISSDLGALEELTWIGSAYLLTITAFQPTYGNCYKFFQVEIVYHTCIIIFEVGTVLCAAAPTSWVFILGRAIAGIGAAGVLQGALCIIGYTVKLEKRPVYMGIIISVFAISVCVGPLIGGALTTHTTWRWCFWINLPIGALVLGVLFFTLRIKGIDETVRKLPLKEKLQRMDLVGTVFFLGAICCLLLAWQWAGQSVPWKSSTIIGLFIGFGLLIGIFGYIQYRRGEHALVPLRILRQRSVLMGAFVLFFLGASTYVNTYYLPFYFQVVQGVDAVTSGIRFIPLFLPYMVALIVTGAIVTQWGYYVPYMILGEVIAIIGTAFLTRLDENTSTVAWAAYMVIAGIGMGMAMQLPYTAVQVVLSEEDIAIGNAIAVFSWQLGGVVSVAIGQNLSLNTILTELPALTTAISPASVISVGATGLQTLTSDPSVVACVRAVWNIAVSRTMIFSLAACCAAVPFNLGMEWLNAKHVAKRRRLTAEDSRLEDQKAEV